MGNTQSSTTVNNTVKQSILNKSDITTIKENITNNIMNSITNKSSSCSASANNDQTKNTTIGTISGVKNLKVGSGTMDQNVTLKLSCIDITSVQNQMATDIQNAFATQLNNKFDTEAMNKIDSNAKSQAERGAITMPFSGSSSSSNSNTNYELSNTNISSQTMKDIVNNNIQKTFNTSTLSEKIGYLQQQQKASVTILSIADSENLDLNSVSMRQDASLVLDAITNDSTINTTTDNIITELNGISTTDVKSKAASDVKSEASSSAKSVGLESIVKDLLEGTTQMLGGIMSGLSGLLGGPILIILLVVGAVFLVFWLNGGSETTQGVIQNMSPAGAGANVAKSFVGAVAGK